jgi:DNA invertase Pin-like site-specific DNA recombinase
VKTESGSKLSVAVYARVSSKDGRQDTENQLAQLRRYCRKQGWRIAQEYIDQETGSTSKRERFQALFEDARTRQFDLVLFWALDRFSREGVLETLKHLERLTSYGAGWKSFTEEYLDSLGPFKDAVLAILASIAKQERIRISERTRAGLEKARSRGTILGRPALVLDTRKIKGYRERGMTIRQIADKLHCSTFAVFRRLEEHERRR